GLDAGLTAAAGRGSPEPGPYHGVIGPRLGLDPRDDPDAVLSAHRLQTLGTCPLRYFYRYVLHLATPDEADIASDRWLDPRVRGGLLHAVYEVSLRRARVQGIALATPAFDALIDDALAEALAHTRRIVPTPGESVLRREVDALRADAATFVRMIRDLDPDCVEVELAFGFGAGEPVRIDLPGGAIQLGGRIDRIDRLPDGRLVVVDYKTGAVRPFRRDTGVFDGGRRLQHALYAHAAELLLGHPVARAEYHFPTRKGRSETRAYDAAVLRPALPLIDGLLDMAASGRFLPTPHPEDCRFCDYAAICRARPARYDAMDSPLAAWAAERVAEGAPAYDPLRAAREERTGDGPP
ncbi:MAG: RecB family exonuclease, partial [Longimicrobiales bacterium]